MRSGENLTKSEIATLHVPNCVPDWLNPEQESEKTEKVYSRLMKMGINTAGTHVFSKLDSSKSASLFARAYTGSEANDSNLRLIFKQTDWQKLTTVTYDYLLSLEDESMTCAKSAEDLPPKLLNNKRQLRLGSSSAPAMVYSESGEISLYYGRDYADAFDARRTEQDGSVLAGQLLGQLESFENCNRLEVNSVNFLAV